jgi:chromosomal replication initiator protein
MHAIAHELNARQPDLRVLYLSAEQFMYRFVQALRDKQIMDFKEIFRSVDVLMVDDVQFIAGKDSTQEEFFHTFNALVDQNKQIVISADRAPGEIKDLEDRIKSRLQCKKQNSTASNTPACKSPKAFWTSWRIVSPPMSACWKAL